MILSGLNYARGEAYETTQGIIHWFVDAEGVSSFITTFYAPKVVVEV